MPALRGRKNVMIRFREESPEVLYNKESVIEITCQDIQWLKNRSFQNERKKIRLCSHENVQDSVHEMLIVHQRDTYVRPHKHLGKSESFHIIEGMADLVLFNDDGSIKRVLRMGEYTSELVFYYRISSPAYHTLVIHSDTLVFHEITSGPFNRLKTVFADWSPDQNDKLAYEIYMSHLSNCVANWQLQTNNVLEEP